MANLVGSVSELLRRGEHGREVEKLQVALNRFGYNVKPDGHFGPETAAAVRHLQRHAGLGNDGVVGPETYTALQQQAAADYHVGADWDRLHQSVLHAGSAHHVGAHVPVPMDASHAPEHAAVPGWSHDKPDDPTDSRDGASVHGSVGEHAEEPQWPSGSEHEGAEVGAHVDEYKPDEEVTHEESPDKYATGIDEPVTDDHHAHDEVAESTDDHHDHDA